MPSIDSFEQQIATQWPPATWCDVTVLVAVSGGADSVALLRALHAIRSRQDSAAGQLIVAHFNHRLRGEESDADERFVLEIARSLELPCEVGRANWDLERQQADAPAGSRPGGDIRPVGGSEASLRKHRYAFLRQAAKRRGARYVATAHAADDQAETVLHRVIRGTGLNGLAGIRRFRKFFHGVVLVRPMLALRRSDARSYLAAVGQTYREDSSNASHRYTRNRLRLDLIPRIEEQFNASTVPALARLAELAEDVRLVIADQVELLMPCVRFESLERVVVDCPPLHRARKLLVRELFVEIWKHQQWPRQAMGFDKWDDLANLALQPLDGATRLRRTYPGAVAGERMGDRLLLERRRPQE